MKEIISVEVSARAVDNEKCKTDLLVAGHFSDSKGLDKVCKELNCKLNGAIAGLIESGDFNGKFGRTAVIYSNGKIAAQRLLLIGLGEKKKADLNAIRKASAIAANKAVEMKISKMSLTIHQAFPGRFDVADVASVMAEGVYFGSFRYDEFVTQNQDGRLDKISVEIIDGDANKIKKLSKGLATGAIIGKAQSYARTLANRPGNLINPAELANKAKELVRGSKAISYTVFDEKQLADKSMGGILAVGAGSKSAPRLIVLKYSPAGKAKSGSPTIALIGKAITFDSGGISIKPAANMEQMKLDKSGGIAVLGAIKAAADMKLPLNIYGIIPSAENMPSGSSSRPGDIITTFSGKTVEIQNTDAEGRLILCDALAYAVKQKCDVIIDIATLTGACMVALGKYKAGLMGNDEKLIKQLEKAAEKSGEDVWYMPSGDEYAEEMKSKIADLKNIGSKWGGACTAAAFLRQFVGESKWAHIDMAGVDMFEKASEFAFEGASGFGVRLLTTYLMSVAGVKD